MVILCWPRLGSFGFELGCVVGLHPAGRDGAVTGASPFRSLIVTKAAKTKTQKPTSKIALLFLFCEDMKKSWGKDGGEVYKQKRKGKDNDFWTKKKRDKQTKKKPVFSNILSLVQFLFFWFLWFCWKPTTIHHSCQQIFKQQEYTAKKIACLFGFFVVFFFCRTNKKELWNWKVEMWGRIFVRIFLPLCKKRKNPIKDQKKMGGLSKCKQIFVSFHLIFLFCNSFARNNNTSTQCKKKKKKKKKTGICSNPNVLFCHPSITHKKKEKTKSWETSFPKKNTTHNTRQKERLTCLGEGEAYLPFLDLTCFGSVVETQIPESPHSTLEMGGYFCVKTKATIFSPITNARKMHPFLFSLMIGWYLSLFQFLFCWVQSFLGTGICSRMKPSAVHVLHSWQKDGLHKMVFEHFQHHSFHLLFPKPDWPIPKYLWNLAKLVLELFLLLDLPTQSTFTQHSWVEKLFACSGTSCVSGDGDWGEKIFVVVFALFCWQNLFGTIGPVIGAIRSKVLFLVRDSIFGLLSFKVAYCIWHSCQELSTSDEEEQ